MLWSQSTLPLLLIHMSRLFRAHSSTTIDHDTETATVHSKNRALALQWKAKFNNCCHHELSNRTENYSSASSATSNIKEIRALRIERIDGQNITFSMACGPIPALLVTSAQKSCDKWKRAFNCVSSVRAYVPIFQKWAMKTVKTLSFLLADV